MPLISESHFKASFFNKSSHISTILPALYRKPKTLKYERERILTPDQDFIDLDWIKTGSRRLIIVTHGLEGSSYSTYLLGFADTLSSGGWDILAWNMRGCSGVPNLKLKSYHSGSSDDLQLVFSHALFKKFYDEIVLVGFSLGGNVTLKFLGEQSSSISGLIAGAVVISTPCCLETAAEKTNTWQNTLYRRYFLSSMRQKLIEKQKVFPNYLPNLPVQKLKTFLDFDNYYTAPVHGFRTAREYWRLCSSKHYLHAIEVPTLILNAQNDPLLTKECFPFETAQNSKYVFLEAPKHGGHVGFEINKTLYYSELRTIEFLENYVTSNSYSSELLGSKAA